MFWFWFKLVTIVYMAIGLFFTVAFLKFTKENREELEETARQKDAEPYLDYAINLMAVLIIFTWPSYFAGFLRHLRNKNTP